MSEPHQARKRFGQNFLSDKNIIYKIIEAIRPDHALALARGLEGQNVALALRAWSRSTAT